MFPSCGFLLSYVVYVVVFPLARCVFVCTGFHVLLAVLAGCLGTETWVVFGIRQVLCSTKRRAI